MVKTIDYLTMSTSSKDFISGVGIDTLISTVVSNTVIKKFDLEYSYFGVVFAIVMNVIGVVKNDFDIKSYFATINVYFWLLFVLCCICYTFRVQLYKLLKCDGHKKYILINVYDPEKIVMFKDYMEYFPEFFNKLYDTDIGNHEFIGEYLTAPDNQLFNDDFYTNMNMISAVCDINIEFNDKNLNTKGYIIWDQYEYAQKIFWPSNNNNKNSNEGGHHNQQKKLNIKYMKLFLEKSSMFDVNDYIKKVQKFVETKEIDKDIQKYFIKVLKNTTDVGSDICYHTVQIYDGPKNSVAENEKLYIDTFFHKEKDRLWSHIKSINEDPLSYKKVGQSPRLNLLLYGPPGSGKSSLAYRVAMSLNRHLISLDLREIKNKRTIYQVLHSPYDYKPCEVVFILDEFDLTIKHLYNSDKMRKEYLKMMYDQQFLNKKLKAMTRKESHKSLKSSKNSKDKDRDKDSKDIMHSDSDDDDQHASSNNNKSKTDSVLVGDFGDNEFTLKDLLEIFQGAAPIDKMIIIATTNDYDGIKELCPELFRSGRLTAVEFGYLDKKSLQALSMFYFNKELTIDITADMKIPTSQIVEKALELRSCNTNTVDDMFNKFQQYILLVKQSN